jgi:hypothetical protein
LLLADAQRLLVFSTLRLLFFLDLVALPALFGFLTWYLWLVVLPPAYAAVKLFSRRQQL